MKLANFFLMMVLVGTLGVLGCDSDSGTGGTAGTGGSVDPNLCNEELCAMDTDLGRAAKEVCLDEYDDCLSGDGDPATCKVLAEETCTV